MFSLRKYRSRARTWIKQEIARHTQMHMLSYTAARQAMDLYEMRLETLDTRLGKRVRELEAKVVELEAALAVQAEARRAELSAPQAEIHRKAG